MIVVDIMVALVPEPVMAINPHFTVHKHSLVDIDTLVVGIDISVGVIETLVINTFVADTDNTLVVGTGEGAAGTSGVNIGEVAIGAAIIVKEYVVEIKCVT